MLWEAACAAHRRTECRATIGPRGGQGALALADAVMALAEQKPAFRPLCRLGRHAGPSRKKWVPWRLWFPRGAADLIGDLQALSQLQGFEAPGRRAAGLHGQDAV